MCISHATTTAKQAAQDRSYFCDKWSALAKWVNVLKSAEYTHWILYHNLDLFASFLTHIIRLQKHFSLLWDIFLHKWKIKDKLNKKNVKKFTCYFLKTEGIILHKAQHAIYEGQTIWSNLGLSVSYKTAKVMLMAHRIKALCFISKTSHYPL